MPRAYPSGVPKLCDHINRTEQVSTNPGEFSQTPKLQGYQGIVSRSMALPLEHSKRVRLYVNGDKNRTATSYVVNNKRTRTWEGLLMDWSERLRPSFGAVRRVYTPNRGTEVTNIRQLKEDGVYVVSGQEKLRSRPQGYPPDEAPPADFQNHVNVRRTTNYPNKGVQKVGQGYAMS